jgi:hypothetical protein
VFFCDGRGDPGGASYAARYGKTKQKGTGGGESQKIKQKIKINMPKQKQKHRPLFGAST